MEIKLQDLEKEVEIPPEFLLSVESYPNLLIFLNLSKKGKFAEALGFYRSCSRAGTFLYTREELQKTKSRRGNQRNKKTYGGWWVNGGKEETKNKLLAERGFSCEICKEKHTADNLTIDHNVPIKRGGSKTKTKNLQLLCRPCHADKEQEHQTFVGNLINQI